MSIFNELKDSLAEALDIKHGRRVAGRVADYDAAGVTAMATTPSSTNNWPRVKLASATNQRKGALLCP